MILEFHAIQGLPLFKKGDDIGRLVSERFAFRGNDILLVASTIVSKSEGRVVLLDDIEPSAAAKKIAKRKGDDPRFVELILQEGREVVEMDGLLLARTPFGHVGPNAGLDRSNTDEGTVLLLPLEPEKSAEKIAGSIYRKQGARVGVIITDTCGRPFRHGQTGVALGFYGILAMRDWRGNTDLYGRELKVSCEAIVDELAAAANLLMGEASDGVPAVVCRGLEPIEDRDTGENEAGRGFDELYRSDEEDMVYRVLKEYYGNVKR